MTVLGLPHSLILGPSNPKSEVQFPEILDCGSSCTTTIQLLVKVEQAVCKSHR